MADRICLNDGKLIPADRRADALYCCNNCGTEYRNKMKKVADQDMKPHDRQLRINRNIIRKLVSMGKIDVSIEALELMGFDFEYCTGVGEVNPISGIVEYQLYEFTLTIDNNRCKIKK